MKLTQGYDEHAPSTREAEPGTPAPTHPAEHIASAGEGADGLVRIELDGDGRLWDVVLDPRITELTVDDLRTALFDAITEAQAGIPADHAGAFEDAVADATSAAERRLAAISEALQDLSRQAARR